MAVDGYHRLIAAGGLHSNLASGAHAEGAYPVAERGRAELELELIEPTEQAVSVLDGDFFGYLNDQLTRAVGPIASVLIEDSVADLGHSMSRFPSHRAAELVNLLDRQI